MNITFKKLALIVSFPFLLIASTHAKSLPSQPPLLLASNAEVSSSSKAEDKTQHKNQDIKDAWLNGKVEVAITLNRHLNSFTIDTDVKNGVVTLSGKVESEVDRELAEEVAKSIDGVVEVENHLTVDSNSKKRPTQDEGFSLSQKINDLTITATVKSKLLANEHTKGMDINVDTTNGMVLLRGDVNTDEEKQLAELVTKNTEGVRGIKNEIVVAN